MKTGQRISSADTRSRCVVIKKAAHGSRVTRAAAVSRQQNGPRIPVNPNGSTGDVPFLGPGIKHTGRTVPSPSSDFLIRLLQFVFVT